MLIVSPHLDDAVLSVGQLMAGRPDTVVLTVFAGTPPHGGLVKTTFDTNSGFPHAFRAMAERRHEDHAALATLDATPRHLRELDGQYRPAGYDPEICARVVNEIVAAMDDLGVDTALGPVGLAHPDHLLVAHAFGGALALRPDVAGWVYEELPARVLWPEEVPGRLEDWDVGDGNGTVPGFLGTGDRARKEAAIRCYGSQLWALDWPTLLVPERIWRVA